MLVKRENGGELALGLLIRNNLKALARNGNGNLRPETDTDVQKYRRPFGRREVERMDISAGNSGSEGQQSMLHRFTGPHGARRDARSVHAQLRRIP